MSAEIRAERGRRKSEAPSGAGAGPIAGPAVAFDGTRSYEHAEHLCGKIGARLTGSAGEHKAAAYIAKAFRSFGLKTTTQRFPSITYDNRTCVLEVRQGRRWRRIEAEPVLLGKNTPAAGVEGEIFLAQSGHLEYLAPEMKDKIVVAWGPIRAEDRRRVIRLGAKAIVTIRQSMMRGVRRVVHYDDERQVAGNLPMATVQYAEGLEMIKAGVTRARLILRNTESKSHSLNVIGELPGTDFAEEIVTVCAHYDTHWRSPGATDNGGGTAVMMELARVLAARPSRRTLRFIAFAGEETGLFGSRFYAEQLCRKDRRERKAKGFNERTDRTERERHRFTFNIDVQGCAMGHFRATFTGVEDIAASIRLLGCETGTFCEVEKKPMSSDGTPLAAVGIPNVQFARRGAANQYGHQPGDVVGNLSPEALEAAGRFAELYLRRYVTDAPKFPFAREIPDDQVKAVKQYLDKNKMTMPGGQAAE